MDAVELCVTDERWRAFATSKDDQYYAKELEADRRKSYPPAKKMRHSGTGRQRRASLQGKEQRFYLRIVDRIVQQHYDKLHTTEYTMKGQLRVVEGVIKICLEQEIHYAVLACNVRKDVYLCLKDKRENLGDITGLPEQDAEGPTGLFTLVMHSDPDPPHQSPSSCFYQLLKDGMETKVGRGVAREVRDLGTVSIPMPDGTSQEPDAVYRHMLQPHASGKPMILQVAYHHESVTMLWDELHAAVRDVECIKVAMGINVSTYRDPDAFRDPYLSFVAVSEVVINGSLQQVGHGPCNFGLSSECEEKGMDQYTVRISCLPLLRGTMHEALGDQMLEIDLAELRRDIQTLLMSESETNELAPLGRIDSYWNSRMDTASNTWIQNSTLIRQENVPANIPLSITLDRR